MITRCKRNVLLSRSNRGYVGGEQDNFKYYIVNNIRGVFINISRYISDSVVYDDDMCYIILVLFDNSLSRNPETLISLFEFMDMCREILTD